jgi:uncharacterized protein (TIGR02145 family)
MVTRSGNFKLLVFSALGFIITAGGCSKNENTVTVKNLQTGEATYVGQKWAIFNAVVIPAGHSAEIAFDYDTSSAFRYSVSAVPDTVSGTESTDVYAVITGLSRKSTYYFRVKSIVDQDTAYGSSKSFVTTGPGSSQVTFNSDRTYGTVEDVDGNIYRTIVIGAKTWMAENLRTTRFSDGSSIPFHAAASYWSDSASLGYSWYNNDSVIYGAFYNWNTVNTGKLCPAGWHVPSNSEWSELITETGGENSAAASLKEKGTEHWIASNPAATNESGFTALAGGYRTSLGLYNNIKHYAYFWTATENTAYDAFCRFIYCEFESVNQTASTKLSGLSVRCVKD